VPPSPPVPPGKIRLCIAGFHISPHTGRARKIASLIARKFPDQYETWYVWGSSSEYESFIIERTRDVPFPPELKGHGSSPFVYLEQGASKTTTPIGGREQLAQLGAQELHRSGDRRACERVEDRRHVPRRVLLQADRARVPAHLRPAVVAAHRWRQAEQPHGADDVANRRSCSTST